MSAAGLRFLLDEHLGGPLWKAIGRHNARPDRLAIDAYHVGVPPAPPRGTPDPDLLDWAETHGCILVTRDRTTMPFHLEERLSQGWHSPGVFLLTTGRSIGDLVEFLAAVTHASEAWEWADRVTFV